MKRLTLLAIVVVGVSGCGDNITTIVHDDLVARNEVADLLLNVVDDGSAKFFIDVYGEKLKKRFENLKARKDLYIKVQDIAQAERVAQELLSLINKELVEKRKGIVPVSKAEVKNFLEEALSNWGKDEFNKKKVGNGRVALEHFMAMLDPNYYEEVAMIKERISHQIRRIERIGESASRTPNGEKQFPNLLRFPSEFGSKVGGAMTNTFQ